MRRILNTDLFAPPWIYAFFWGVGSLLHFFLQATYSVQPNPKVVLLILFNIVSFFFIHKIIENYYPKQPKVFNSKEFELDSIYSFAKWLFYFWLFGFTLSIVHSKGFPLYWKIVGDPKTYVDFGIPTFFGLISSMRLFASVSFLFVFKLTKNKNALLLLILLVLSAFMEMSRGTITVLVLNLIGIFIVLEKFSWRKFFQLFTLFFMFTILFGIVGYIRNNDYTMAGMILPGSVFEKLPGGFFTVFTYWTSPINNLHFATDLITPLYKPYYTLIGLVPTIVRDSFFTATYPLPLRIDALNATSYYAPFIADFGIYFAAILILPLQFILSTIYMRAKNGNHYYALAYSQLFASLVLSTFFLYFLSLITIFYIFLSFACYIYVSTKKGNIRG